MLENSTLDQTFPTQIKPYVSTYQCWRSLWVGCWWVHLPPWGSGWQTASSPQPPPFLAYVPDCGPSTCIMTRDFDKIVMLSLNYDSYKLCIINSVIVVVRPSLTQQSYTPLYILYLPFSSQVKTTSYPLTFFHHQSLISHFFFTISYDTDRFIKLSRSLGQPTMSGGLWRWWTAHMMRTANPRSWKGTRLVSTSHIMMPQLYTSHFSVYTFPAKFNQSINQSWRAKYVSTAETCSVAQRSVLEPSQSEVQL